MTARDLIKGALRVIGVLPSGEEPNANEANEALEALQLMLRRWSAKSLDVYAMVEDSVALTAGKGNYTYGSGGDINASRPKEIRGAFVRDANNNDYFLEIIDETRYRSITAKSIEAELPQYLYYNPTYPLGTVYLWAVPSDSSYSLHISTLKALTELTDLSDSVSFPEEYQDAIKWNLAVMLAPEYGARINPVTAAMAQESLETLERVNSIKNLSLSVSSDMSQGRRYNVYTDT